MPVLLSIRAAQNAEKQCVIRDVIVVAEDVGKLDAIVDHICPAVVPKQTAAIPVCRIVDGEMCMLGAIARDVKLLEDVIVDVMPNLSPGRHHR